MTNSTTCFAFIVGATLLISHPVHASEKIISIGGDVTEILYALGAEADIVAVDTTSTFPDAALKSKPNVGYMRALSTEGVLSTGGKTIIASDRAGPPDVIAALRSANIAFHSIPEDNSQAGIAAKIKLVGDIAAKSEQAKALSARVTDDFEKLSDARAVIKTQKSALFVLAVQNGRVTIAGRGTSADAMFELAGLKNAANSIDGFKPVTSEQVLELQPDAIIVMKRGEGNKSVLTEVKQIEAILATPAAKAGLITEFDGTYLLSFGPRAPLAALDLMQAVYGPITAPLVQSN
jgi:iron complex transport system substrate-binding protein